MDEFIPHVLEKAIRRAKEKDRPMDPWNEFEPEFIRGRLIMEIGEFLKDFLSNDNEDGRSLATQIDEESELFDIVVLACSLWKAHHP